MFFIKEWKWSSYMLNYLTKKRLSNINFSRAKIVKILANLNSNKAHGHDKITICMLQICGDTICIPLEIVFKKCFETGVVPPIWKNGNIVPIHKKGNSNLWIVIVLFHFADLLKKSREAHVQWNVSFFP